MKLIKKITFLSIFALSAFGNLSAIQEEFPEGFSCRIDDARLVRKLVTLISMIENNENLFQILSVQLSIEICEVKYRLQELTQYFEETIKRTRAQINDSLNVEEIKSLLKEHEDSKELLLLVETDKVFIEQLQSKYCWYLTSSD